MIDLPRSLETYEAEVLRWNRQINLVSRQDTAGRVSALVAQCRAAWQALAGSEPGVAAPGLIQYCDLGSGGGLPGLVWLAEMRAAGLDTTGLMVEPRAKRAWFLERTARLMDIGDCEVIAARWGECASAAPQPEDWALVSLKALRLTDAEVLGGLAATCGANAESVTIVRFYPEGAHWGSRLEEELQPANPGARLDAVEGAWVGGGTTIVPVPPGNYPDTALVVTRYNLQP